jgi:hypothetical protein
MEMKGSTMNGCKRGLMINLINWFDKALTFWGRGRGK